MQTNTIGLYTSKAQQTPFLQPPSLVCANGMLDRWGRLRTYQLVYPQESIISYPPVYPPAVYFLSICLSPYLCQHAVHFLGAGRAALEANRGLELLQAGAALGVLRVCLRRPCCLVIHPREGLLVVTGKREGVLGDMHLGDVCLHGGASIWHQLILLLRAQPQCKE